MHAALQARDRHARERTRDQPAGVAREALADCEVVGPKSNIDFLEKLVRHPRVVEGTIHTAYLDAHLDEVLPKDEPLPDAHLAMAAAAALLHDEAATLTHGQAGPDPHSPWSIGDGWRLGHASERLLCFNCRGERIELHARGSAGDYRLLMTSPDQSLQLLAGAVECDDAMPPRSSMGYGGTAFGSTAYGFEEPQRPPSRPQGLCRPSPARHYAS